MHFFSAALGRVCFLIGEEDLSALWNLLLQRSFPFTGLTREGDNVRFWVRASDARRLAKAAEEIGLRLTLVERRGLPALFFSYRHRFGLLVGGLIALLLLFFSSRVVWDVRITGNERIPTGEIETLLAENGLSAGVSLRKIHAGELENRVLLATDKLSWLSVNLSGTVAYVQVMEAVFPPEQKEMSPANLVATADGQIETIQLYRGKSLVKVGQAVRMGELLVSGIADTGAGGFRYTRAAGEVLARTEREITVEIPFVVTEERTLAKKVAQVNLHFFGRTAKIYKRTGKIGEKCAIIEVQKGLDRMGLFHVPVFLTDTLIETRESVFVLRAREEVLELAYRELSALLEGLSDDLQLLEKRIVTEWSDEGVTLHCSIKCIENIAKQVEFEVLS